MSVDKVKELIAKMEGPSFPEDRARAIDQLREHKLIEVHTTRFTQKFIDTYPTVAQWYGETYSGFVIVAPNDSVSVQMIG